MEYVRENVAQYVKASCYGCQDEYVLLQVADPVRYQIIAEQYGNPYDYQTYQIYRIL